MNPVAPQKNTGMKNRYGALRAESLLSSRFGGQVVPVVRVKGITKGQRVVLGQRLRRRCVERTGYSLRSRFRATAS